MVRSTWLLVIVMSDDRVKDQRAAYMRQYRKTNLAKARRAKDATRARGRALVDLAEQYPAQFSILHNARRREAGLPATR